jgi:hypothetical protein
MSRRRNLVLDRYVRKFFRSKRRASGGVTISEFRGWLASQKEQACTTSDIRAALEHRCFRLPKRRGRELVYSSIPAGVSLQAT